MREILFRGKTVDKDKWLEGWYGEKSFGAWPLRPAITPFEDARRGHLYYEEVKPETVGQYSGLTDKNGKKIFEGDILKGDEYPYTYDGECNYFAEVVWFEDCPAFGLYTFKNPQSKVRGISDGASDYINNFDSSKWEVIGNIYDNPEILMEDEKDGNFEDK